MKSPDRFDLKQSDIDVLLKERWEEFLRVSKMQFVDEEAARMAAIIFTNGYYMAVADFNELGLRLSELKNIIQEL